MITRFNIIDKIRKTHIVNKYYELNKFQSCDKSFLLNEQQKRLGSLLIYLRNKNKFYGTLLKSFSESEILAQPGEILSTLPIVDKDFLNQNYKNIFNRDVETNIQRKQTGGSTGTPFKFLLNTESISYTWSFIYLFWKKYAEYNLGDPFCSVAGNTFYSLKKKLFYFFYHSLQNNYLIKGDVISKNMDFNRKRIAKAKLIYGYPSSINLLLEYYPDLFADSKNLKAIFTTSELLTPQVRENIERKTNKKIYDMYGANDGGISSSECHLHNGHHYNMLSCYAESKDAAATGQSELVVTNLYNFDFPFVRYKVGDLGTIDKSQCACGNPFDKIINLKGRTRELLYRKNNKAVHGSAINSLLFKHPEVKLYKVIQKADYSVDLQIMVVPQEYYNSTAEKILKEVSQLFRDLIFTVTKLTEVDATDKKFKIIESYVSLDSNL